MKGLVRALYRILLCTALHVLGVRASDDLQMIAIDSDSETKTPMSPLIQNEDMNFLLELLDDSLDNFASFELMQTEDIRTAHYACLPSSSTILHKHDMNHPKEYTEQTDPLPSFYSAVCEPSAECPSVCCTPNEPVQKHTESKSSGNYERSSKAKRPKKAIEENIPRKKQKKTEENSLDSDSVDNDEFNSKKIGKIKNNISIWKNSRLNNRHRESWHVGYKLVVAFDMIGNNIYKDIGNEKHQSMIETHVEYCKAVYSEIPTQNEFWFVIASRSTRMHTKLADCKAMNANPSDYKFIEGLSGYYPGLPGDIIEYIDKHGPIISDKKSIKTEWKETLGDIYIRTPIKSEYGINKETITFETCNEYRSVATAVQMILCLPEVHKDLSNITTKFAEKTLKEETDLNHLKVIKALQKIVKKHKSSNKSNVNEQYAALCTIIEDIPHQTDIPYESMVIQLYTEMYKSLAYFYEKAEVCEEILDIEKKEERLEEKKNTICSQESASSSHKGISSALQL